MCTRLQAGSRGFPGVLGDVTLCKCKLVLTGWERNPSLTLSHSSENFPARLLNLHDCSTQMQLGTSSKGWEKSCSHLGQEWSDVPTGLNETGA